MALNEHPDKIWDMIAEIQATVKLTKSRVNWTIEEILRALDVAPSTYYRVLKYKGMNIKSNKRNIYQLLPEEREAIIDYALQNPNPRHRELAYKMIDDGIVCTSPSTVYRVLDEANLIPKWPVTTDEDQESKPKRERALAPDETWQVDLSYINIDNRWWFLIFFIDEYSRHIVHWELLWSMDANTILVEAEKALALEGRSRDPVIQTDNGPPFIAREFKRYLSFKEIAHKRIHPHTPEENAIVERGFRTIKELAGSRFADLTEAKNKIKEMVDYYNNERLHSSLHYLRPIDYYRGNPIELLEIRREKIAYARERRRQINLGINQKSICPEKISI